MNKQKESHFFSYGTSCILWKTDTLITGVYLYAYMYISTHICRAIFQDTPILNKQNIKHTIDSYNKVINKTLRYFEQSQ